MNKEELKNQSAYIETRDLKKIKDQTGNVYQSINVLKIKRDPDESPAAMARLTKNNPVYQLQLIHRH